MPERAGAANLAVLALFASAASLSDATSFPAGVVGALAEGGGWSTLRMVPWPVTSNLSRNDVSGSRIMPCSDDSGCMLGAAAVVVAHFAEVGEHPSS